MSKKLASWFIGGSLCLYGLSPGHTAPHNVGGGVASCSRGTRAVICKDNSVCSSMEYYVCNHSDVLPEPDLCEEGGMEDDPCYHSYYECGDHSNADVSYDDPYCE
ncbi:hypothetical protein Poly41_16510 [Novipirellula artificiosorum]|uniref:Uncharacterized protein n=1 Tax=Novipirellula artificiosorum TaxID=2528016 RepID=A0A5C6E0F1_9BACT|nr:hypothetical protein Poly41_16510 [Novipirellula artificiosorum]